VVGEVSGSELSLIFFFFGDIYFFTLPFFKGECEVLFICESTLILRID